ncbi:MAG: M90 family metallopeptidase [Verrucomicrobiota bacterium]
MTGVALLLLLLAAVLVVPALARRRRAARRERLRRKPFPAEWRAILERNVPLYRHLPEPLQQQLHGHIHVFLAEKNFEGAGGLEMNDEIRVTIAARACILLLNRPTDYYPRLYSIIVYPEAYEVDEPVYFSGSHHIESTDIHLGESGPTGAVVLAWDQASRAGRRPEDGHDLVLHEFAHQLDQENASSDGIPILQNTSGYLTWARVLGKEYRRLQRRAEAGQPTLLDQYGATNEAEFFAVATECFFDQPQQMKRQYPELYEELKRYYSQDPAAYGV